MSIKPGKYYAFDLDGNIAKLRTPIYVTRHGQDVVIDPMQYAEVQEKVRNRLDGWAPCSDKAKTFRAFGPDEEYDGDFVKSLLAAEAGPVAPDFAEAVNGGNMFAIVTARGHSVEAFKKGFREVILNGLWGTDPNAMAASVGEFVRRARENDAKVELPRNWSHRALVDYYLDRCMWYPVTNTAVRAQLTPPGVDPMSMEIEDLKVVAIRRIIETVKKASKVILKAGEVVTLGVSDDTPANWRSFIHAMVNRAFHEAEVPENVVVYVYDTSAPREGAKDTTVILRKRCVHKHGK